MIKELYFAFYSIKKNIQNSAELRTSFLISVIGMIINNMSFIVLWIFFVKSVGIINGWTEADIIGLLGFSSLCYGMVYSVAAGIGELPDYVNSGAFDRFMISPKNLLMRIATSSFGVSALGDIIFGLACIIIYGLLIHVGATQIIIGGALIIISTALFLSLLIAICSVSFFFVDAFSIVGGLFELFFTPSLFHGGAFQGVTRFIFTFFIPSLAIGALPVEILRDVSFEKLLLITIIAIAWLILSLAIFNAGVKKYESSNFMTFGN